MPDHPAYRPDHPKVEPMTEEQWREYDPRPTHGPVTQHGTIRSLDAIERTDGDSSHERQAYELGCEHARNAASWVIDGNTSEGHVRRLVAMLDEGDPAVFDYLPREPNLSGEYADDPTPQSLVYGITGRARPADEIVDALCDAYESGVSETFQSECERILRAALEN